MWLIASRPQMLRNPNRFRGRCRLRCRRACATAQCFIGYLALAFDGKRVARRASLGTLFASAQLTTSCRRSSWRSESSGSGSSGQPRRAVGSPDRRRSTVPRLARPRRSADGGRLVASSRTSTRSERPAYPITCSGAVTISQTHDRRRVRRGGRISTPGQWKWCAAARPSPAGAAAGSRDRFERLGYFCVDPDSGPDGLSATRRSPCATPGPRSRWPRARGAGLTGGPSFT